MTYLEYIELSPEEKTKLCQNAYWSGICLKEKGHEGRCERAKFPEYKAGK